MTKCKTILIIDDDETIRQVLKLTLEFFTYVVITAENGKTALEHLNTFNAPCFILLDLMMPDMDGWSFAETLKGSVQYSSIPFVVLTAFSDQEVSIGNAAGIIKKPIDICLITFLNIE